MSYYVGPKVYCVSYELRVAGKNYEPLYNELKKSTRWWHYLQSTWLIQTDETAVQVWQRLVAHVDQQDSVLLIEVRNNAQGWLPKDAWDWIRDNVPPPSTLTYCTT